MKYIKKHMSVVEFRRSRKHALLYIGEQNDVRNH